MSKVLVTGADGFIGSHLTERLVAEGYDVRALTLYNSFGSSGWLDKLDPELVRRIEVVTGDIRDAACMREAVKGCATVFHLAALIAIPYSYRAPESYIDTNVKGTLNVLQAAQAEGVERVIHTSTSEVYGTAVTVPIDEDHRLNAQSPYAASKIAADQIALSFHRSFGLPVMVLRPFNTYGPRQSARAVVPTIITQIANGERAVRLGALHPTRDLSYVDDTVSGFLAAARADIGKTAGRVINVGSSFEVSIGDLAALIADRMGAKVAIETEQARVRPAASEVDRLLCDNRLAADLLGWQPQYQGIEGLRRGLDRTIVWFRNSQNLAFYRSGHYAI
jgi:dTDP-glucose 4,6-dehydratase